MILVESLDVSRSNPFPPVLSTRALVKCWICSFWRPIWGALNGVIDISLYLSISLSLYVFIYIYICLSIDLSLSLARYLSIYLILYYITLSYSNSILFYSILSIPISGWQDHVKPSFLMVSCLKIIQGWDTWYPTREQFTCRHGSQALGQLKVWEISWRHWPLVNSHIEVGQPWIEIQ